MKQSNRRPLKQSLDDLALFGAAPAFDEVLAVGRPRLGNRQRLMARIESALDRHSLTNNGPLVREFEQSVCQLLGVRHCVAMCNGTVGLEVTIRALGLTGEVIVPAMTFVATAHALQWLGLRPVFCDIDPATHNLDPRQVEALITPRTSAILGVHLWGRPCPVDELEAVAQHHNLRLLFDAAHAFGCSRGGRMIGGFGDAEVFSFHATKFLHTFEGGAVTTQDDALAERLRLMRNFGFAGLDQVVEVGTNGKLNEISAAMGLNLLDDFDQLVADNQAAHDGYQAALAGLPGVSVMRFDPRERGNYQYLVLEIDETRAGLSRDQLLEVLWAENVHARRYFFPGCHRMEPYRSDATRTGQHLPATDRLVQRVLCLPAGASASEEAIASIGEILRLALGAAPHLRASMQRREERFVRV